MVKVSGALSGQIMVMYHHCAVPGPPRVASGPHGLRDGINRYFPPHFRKSKRLGVVPGISVILARNACDSCPVAFL